MSLLANVLHILCSKVLLAGCHKGTLIVVDGCGENPCNISVRIPWDFALLDIFTPIDYAVDSFGFTPCAISLWVVVVFLMCPLLWLKRAHWWIRYILIPSDDDFLGFFCIGLQF